MTTQTKALNTLQKIDMSTSFGIVDYAGSGEVAPPTESFLTKRKDQMTNSWIPLMDYSTKHKVSMSTLRRRIKTEDIRFRFEDGKYFILDEEVETHHRAHRPSLTSEKAPVGTLTSASSDKAEPVINAANKLLNELKKAYSQILQEKEEHILQLREEVTDLKTLVRVLESDNERIKRATGYR